MAGERVVVTGRDPGKTSRLTAELGAPAFTADFADLAQVRQLADRLRAACPRIDVLVNNAGAIMPASSAQPTATRRPSRSTTSPRSCSPVC